jgi:holliday junction DNA helicase RuvA
MIATIEGVVAEKIGDTLVIELGGIGYEVIVTASDWGASATGDKAKFYIYDHIKEDSHSLFGFCDTASKQLFVKLLGVNGVGPKVAMQVMGAASLDRLQQAIADGDTDLFKGVSGVGKKTAERIMLDLRGKVDATGTIGTARSGDPAYQALLGLGYSSQQAADAVAKIPRDITDEQLRVKSALKQL